MWIAVFCAIDKCGAKVSMGERTCLSGHELNWKWRICAHCQDKVLMVSFPNRWFDQCPNCYTHIRRASVDKYGLTIK